MITRQHIRGVTAVETVIGVALISLVLLYAVDAIGKFVSLGSTYVTKTQALYLTEDTLESVRFIRDKNPAAFYALTSGTTYYVATSTMTITASPQTVDAFTPKFSLASVRRDNTTDDIVTSGGTIDSSTKLVTATTTWSGGSVTLATYLADISP